MDLRFAHMHKQFSHIITRSFESISLCDSFTLTVTVNCERAALASASLGVKRARARAGLVTQLYEKYTNKVNCMITG